VFTEFLLNYQHFQVLPSAHVWGFLFSVCNSIGTPAQDNNQYQCDQKAIYGNFSITNYHLYTKLADNLYYKLPNSTFRFSISVELGSLTYKPSAYNMCRVRQYAM